jgi:hypothetical protein
MTKVRLLFGAAQGSWLKKTKVRSVGTLLHVYSDPFRSTRWEMLLL